MPSSLSKRVQVRPGLHEYTATATLSHSDEYVEMEFSNAVQISQLAWEANSDHTEFRVWLIDSTGLLQNVLNSAGNPYAMNTVGEQPPRQFDLPSGAKLRLELKDTTGEGIVFFSCLAQSA